MGDFYLYCDISRKGNCRQRKRDLRPFYLMEPTLPVRLALGTIMGLSYRAVTTRAKELG